MEKRRGARLLCAGLVEVRWVDPSDGPTKAVANLDDVSPGGVSLLLDRPVEQGTRVDFLYSGQIVTGDVRHCTSIDIGWVIGVQFGPDSQWDPQALPPEHLLDPTSIPADAYAKDGEHLSQAVGSTIACVVLNKAVQREQA